MLARRVSSVLGLLVQTAFCLALVGIPLTALASTLTTVDFPGATDTEAFGINNPGEIVGLYTVGGVVHGFLRDKKGEFTTIDFPGATEENVASGINDPGEIVGLYVVGGVFHGFLRDKKGKFTTIDFPGAIHTEAFGINDRGEIVGAYADGSGLHGFLRDKKGEFATIDFPGAIDTSAIGINARGEIVGGYTVGPAGCLLGLDCVLHGFLRDKKGEFITVDFPGATDTAASGINARGEIVGDYTVGPAGCLGGLKCVVHGFRRDKKGNLPRSISRAPRPPRPPGSTLAARSLAITSFRALGRFSAVAWRMVI